jgi:hypothetical protein
VAKKNWAVTFDRMRLTEAKQMFVDIAKSIDPATSKSDLKLLYGRAKAEIEEGYRIAAVWVRDKARQNAQSGRTPRRLYSGTRPAIFAFSDFDSARDDKRKRSSLVGVRTGLSYKAKDERLYIEWGYGNRRRKDNSKASGGLSMSLGALFERGTQDRRIKPRRFFRSAVWASRSYVAQILTSAYYRAIGHLNKAK